MIGIYNKTAVIAFFFLCFCIVSASAANHTINGIVLDENNTPLSGVIITINAAGKRLPAHCISGNDGSFSLSFDTDYTKIDVCANILGYQKQSHTVDLPNDVPISFTMLPKSNQLDNIYVMAKPLKAFGDTLIYNVASFKSEADQTIEDVIKHMPGIKVDDSGMISYNGLPINRFYIEKLDMLNGNYSIATQNISADNIASVEVYENHQPINTLRDIVSSKAAALNLTLKNGSINKPIGSVKATGGWSENSKPLWGAEANMSFISRLFQTLFVVKSGNTGVRYEQEINNHYSNSFLNENIAASIFRSDLTGMPHIDKDRFIFNQSNLVSVNFLKKINDTRNISVNISYGPYRDKIDSENQTVYASSDSKYITINRNISSKKTNQLVKGKINFTNNGDKTYLKEQFSITGSFARNSYRIRGNDNIDQSLYTDDLSLTNQLMFTHKKGRRLWIFRSFLHYSLTPDTYIDVYNSDNGHFDFGQHARGCMFTNTEETSMVWLFGRHISIGGKISFKTDYNNFKSRLESEHTYAQEIGYNNIGGWVTTGDIGPYFIWQNHSLKWRLDIPMNLTHYNFHNWLTQNKHKRTYLMPGATSSLEYKHRSGLDLYLTTSYNKSSENFKTFITNPIYLSYRDISSIGNGNPQNDRTITINPSATFRSARHSFFASLSFRCDLSYSDLTSLYDVSEDESVTGFVNSQSHSRNMTLKFNSSKRFNNLNTTIRLSTSYSNMEYSYIRNGDKIDTDASSFAADISLDGNIFSSHLSYNLLFATQVFFNRINSNSNKDEFTNYRIKLNISYFPIKQVGIFCNISNNNNQLSSYNRKNTVFIDAGCRLKQKKWEYDLKFNNLANQHHYELQYFSGPDRIYQNFTFRPLEVMLSARMTY